MLRTKFLFILLWAHCGFTKATVLLETPDETITAESCREGSETVFFITATTKCSLLERFAVAANISLKKCGEKKEVGEAAFQYHGKDKWELTSINLDPLFRGKKIGTSFIAMAEAKFCPREMYVISLQSATEFYKKLGFRPLPVISTKKREKLTDLMTTLVYEYEKINRQSNCFKTQYDSFALIAEQKYLEFQVPFSEEEKKQNYENFKDIYSWHHVYYLSFDEIRKKYIDRINSVPMIKKYY